MLQNEETLSPSYIILEVTLLSSWSPALHLPSNPRASKTCFLVHLQMCTPLAILLMYPLGNLFDRAYSEICSGQMNMLSFIRRTGKEMMRSQEIYQTVIWGLKYSWVNAREQGSCILDYVNRQGLKYNQTVSPRCTMLYCAVVLWCAVCSVLQLLWTVLSTTMQ